MIDLTVVLDVVRVRSGLEDEIEHTYESGSLDMAMDLAEEAEINAGRIDTATCDLCWSYVSGQPGNDQTPGRWELLNHDVFTGIYLVGRVVDKEGRKFS